MLEGMKKVPKSVASSISPKNLDPSLGVSRIHIIDNG
jgi:hypothetical protein